MYYRLVIKRNKDSEKLWKEKLLPRFPIKFPPMKNFSTNTALLVNQIETIETLHIMCSHRTFVIDYIVWNIKQKL